MPTLTEKIDIIEALLFLEDQTIQILGKQYQVTKAFESHIDSRDGLFQEVCVMLETDQGRIPIKIPHIIEETQDSFILNYSAPFNPKTKQQKIEEAEAEDKHFYEFLQRGKGHNYNGDHEKKDVVIKIL